ncbi:EboA domain-containing protein [Gayadomonas joobiniege]|uniref:EboA domain-containing protein n=1 Tax=Gayadomonas joobiniege TaxID=1234606 RepID=UPI00036F08AD|nr:EboA domain-containing protein [Gayadomonas joobiniege]
MKDSNLFERPAEQVLNVEQVEHWLKQATESLACSSYDFDHFLTLSTQSKRALGDFSAQNLPSLMLTNVDYCRGVLFYLFIKHSDEQIKQSVADYYRFADPSEKISLLRSLYYLDESGEAVATAQRAARTNQVDEFSALAFDNPYPAAHFEDLNFNQLVLKSLFMGLDISRVLGLSKRLNPALSNMVFSYAIEQMNASRDVPASLWLAVIKQDLETANLSLSDKVYRYYSQKDPEHKQQMNGLNLI